MVGGVLERPLHPACAAAVIFFNNAGYLGMCGHGTIGLVATLRYLRRIEPGWHRIETPVGDVRAHLAESGDVSIENVRSYRFRKEASVRLADGRVVTGDVAWGGNWFFLATVDYPLLARDIGSLTEYTQQIRDALDSSGVTGEGQAPIDHIELVGPPSDPSRADGRSFVLCPGGLYDRSPCGTGLSAKTACLAADGKLQPGQVWRQESIIGSLFTATYRHVDGGVIPTIFGRAFVNGDLRLVIDPDDPYRYGFRAKSEYVSGER
jgi:4-hydroxyproline epimerase